MAIIIKSDQEIALMRQAGRTNGRILEALARAVRPGITTRALDRMARDMLRAAGATPAFLNYPNPNPLLVDASYPAAINASINDELVHGIPSRRRLKEGDILSIDCGTVYEGFVGDSAITVPVGRISAEARRLLEVTEEALRRAIEVCRVGNRLGDISATIQEWVEGQGFNVVREYTGHGVGRDMHEDPSIPNWGKRNRGVPLRPGMTFALEPMVTAGAPDLVVRADHWTVATADGSLCAHFEHTVAVTDGEPEILTLP
ncbi:MAG TPA: type I methionyl aminopeptidase [Chloroflexi bacterium]|nr:type I methionyl aminopeptidase [Chloroflexota bacterium]